MPFFVRAKYERVVHVNSVAADIIHGVFCIRLLPNDYRIAVTDTLENYKRGKSYLDIPVLRDIEEVYGIPYDRIIFLPLDFGLTEKHISVVGR